MTQRVLKSNKAVTAKQVRKGGEKRDVTVQQMRETVTVNQVRKSGEKSGLSSPNATPGVPGKQKKTPKKTEDLEFGSTAHATLSRGPGRGCGLIKAARKSQIKHGGCMGEIARGNDSCVSTV